MAIRIIAIVVITGLIGITPGLSQETKTFTHPSILHTQEGLDALKTRVKSSPVAKAGYEQFKKSEFVDLSRPHTPYAVVKVKAGGACKEEKAFRDDAHAARATALMWVITGDTRYRDKSMAILNDWASTYDNMDPNSWGRQNQLEAAWALPVWVAAADIIRYYDKGAAGWSSAQIAQFDTFVNGMHEYAYETRRKHNNWGASGTLALMVKAVYQDNVEQYNEALHLHKAKLRKVIQNDGIMKNSDYCRDHWHPQYTLICMIHACEVAWNQGDDAYGYTIEGESLPRMAVCLEHFAKLFTGKLPNPEKLRKGNYKGGHKGKQAYDMAYNHYMLRKRMASSMPTFASMVPDWRPGGLDLHFLGWDTMTHGGLDAE